MKEFFKNLLQYTYHYNNEMINAYDNNKSSLPEKCVTLLSHTINAHSIWNSRITGETVNISTWDVHTVGVLGAMNEDNYHRSAAIVEQYELSTLIRYTAKGNTFNHSVADILYQIINHATYHRGQINTALKENGVQPIITDYIYYKMIGH